MSKELKSISSEITSNELSIIGISTTLNGLSLAQSINSLLNTDLRLCKDFESYNKENNQSYCFKNYHYSNNIHHLKHFLISNKNNENKLLLKTHIKFDYIYVIIGRDNKICASEFRDKVKKVQNIQLIQNVYPTTTSKDQLKQEEKTAKILDIFGNPSITSNKTKKSSTKKLETGIAVKQFIDDIDYYLENVMSNKRIFLAYNVVLNNEVIYTIDKLKNHFSKQNISLIPKENYHLTLQYVGESTFKQLNNIIFSTKEILDQSQNIEVEIDKIHYFHTNDNDLTLFLSIKDNATLEQTYKTIHNEYLKLNLSLSLRKFVPHITIAKIHGVENISLLKQEIDTLFKISPLKLQLSKPILFESVSIGNKVRYDIVKLFE
ncbi:RNA 2',3'-cyclic phosphodiesterase [bioreactor metagenome]|uniref:RNA 2',3'-cyclic phosphodiesterase n=1 Tax=bioreactor metagenome TaxID=1076179 RepID=A0A644U0T7_9ZZZZ|nr:RNA 2',3'-cyclic phosphodiesterase [Bacteroidales bacterium]MDY4790182.1 RNA 2',3'-cyclic phosphodiesterase [Bacteroidales bacterium]NCC17873.1 RNA 2',3'-cyclic phosphodiesterase [Bacteroidia bacterium]